MCRHDTSSLTSTTGRAPGLGGSTASSKTNTYSGAAHHPKSMKAAPAPLAGLARASGTLVRSSNGADR
jgi:hypothetical protein